MKVHSRPVSCPQLTPRVHLSCSSGCTLGHLHMINGASIMYFMGARDRLGGLGKPVMGYEVEEEGKSAV